MSDARKPQARWRSLALVVAGMLVGGVLITPAVAHVGDSLSHLYKHLNKRYVYIMRAERAGSGSFTGESADQTVSSVEIRTPTSGFLVVHGSVHVNNDSGVARSFELYYTIPGVSPAKAGGGEAFAGPDLVGGVVDPAEGVQISYTDAFQVGRGTFTVNQLLGPGIVTPSASWAYANETLIVEFFSDKGAAFS